MNNLISVSVQYEISKLRKGLIEYGALSGKTESEALLKQSQELSRRIYASMREIAPLKGQVRDTQLANLRSGRGVRVRPAVLKAVAEKFGLQPDGKMLRKMGGRVASEVAELGYGSFKRVSTVTRGGKKLNFRALAVKRELAVRESGRGFLAYSTPRSNLEPSNVMVSDIESRYGFVLSTFFLNAPDEAADKYAELKWKGSKALDYETPIPGLISPKAQSKLLEAVQATNANMAVYIDRKMAELAKRLKLT
jgi:hypothetical protein